MPESEENHLKNSVFIFAANWTGGSSLYRLVQELTEGEYIVTNPELLAWRRGKDLQEAGELVPYTPHNTVYYFRNFKPFKEFLENNPIPKGQHRLLVQARDPADLLVASFYGNTLSHAAQPGQQKKWNRKRVQMIRDGVDRFALRKAEKLNERFEWVHSLSDIHPDGLFREEILSYHSFIYQFEDYVRRLASLLELNIDEEKLLQIIESHDALSFIRNGGQGQFSDNLNRMQHPEEWPFPGRAKMVLSKKTAKKIESMTPVFQSTFRDKTEWDLNEIDIPAAALTKNRFRLWFRYIMKVRIRQSIGNVIRRFK